MRRGPLRSLDTFISLLLKAIKQCFNKVPSFRLSKSLYSPSVLFKRNYNFSTISPIVRIVEFTRQDFHHTSASFFHSPLAYFSKHFNLCFDAEKLLLATVAMVSLYQSPFNCKSRKVVRSFRHKGNNL